MLNNEFQPSQQQYQRLVLQYKGILSKQREDQQSFNQAFALRTQSCKDILQHLRGKEQQLRSKRNQYDRIHGQLNQAYRQLLQQGLGQEEILKLPCFVLQFQLQNQICLICYSKLAQGDQCCQLQSCAHMFHKDCLRSQLGQRSFCPACHEKVLI